MRGSPLPARAVVLACAVGLALSALSRAQTPPQGAGQPPAGSGFILGRVVDGATGQPVPEAIVSTNLRPQAPTPSTPGGRQTGPPQLRVLTGLDGRFLFRDLPAGSYTITASAAGYLNGVIGQSRPGGISRPIVLEPDQRVADAVVRLWRAAAISGTVTDEADEPMAGIQVQPLRVEWLAGRRRYQPVNFVRTDDRGHFRLSSLSPGQYLLAVPLSYTTAPTALVTGLYDNLLAGRDMTSMMALSRSMVSPPNPDATRVGNFMVGPSGGFNGTVVVPPPGPDGTLELQPTTFLPGGLSPAETGAFVVESGEERSGVTVQVPRVRAGRVDGLVLDADGQPVATTGVRLVMESVDLSFPPASAITAADGSFTMLGVPPGRYIVRAEMLALPAPPAGQAMNPMMQMMLAGAPKESLVADAIVTVAAGATSAVQLSLRPGVRLRGRARFEGQTPAPAADQMQSFTVMASAIGSVASLPTSPVRGNTSRPGQVQPDATFETQPLAPGRYLIAVNPPAPWRLESAVVGGRDATVEPIDIRGNDIDDVVVTFTDVTAAVTGAIRDRAGETVVDAAVFVIPTDYRRWIERGMTGNADTRSYAPAGTYSFQRLRPGDYLVAAVSGADLMDRNDPGFIERLAPLATPVSLTPGARQTVDLVAVRIVR